jgi:hypothetical protein
VRHPRVDHDATGFRNAAAIQKITPQEGFTRYDAFDACTRSPRRLLENAVVGRRGTPLSIEPGLVHHASGAGCGCIRPRDCASAPCAPVRGIHGQGIHWISSPFVKLNVLDVQNGAALRYQPWYVRVPGVVTAPLTEIGWAAPAG